MTNYIKPLYVDIETLPNDENDDKGALSPLTGTIALIGNAFCDDRIECYTSEYGEEAMLRVFWEKVWVNLKEYGNDFTIVGHNICKFDGPFLIRRAWKYGISVPNVFMEDISAYKPKRWDDTMFLMSLYDKKEHISLEKCCNFFDIPVKTSEIEGKDFYKWWKTDKQKCKDYCIEDVTATRQLYKRIKNIK